MKSFIKKNGIKIVALLVIIYLGILAAGYVNDLFFNKALKIIDDKYKSDITALKDKITFQENSYKEQSEKDKKDRENFRKDAEKDIDHIENVYKKYKSKSVKELKSKNSTIAEVLEEKAKDEIVICEQKELIKDMDNDISGILDYWENADTEKDIKHNEIVATLNQKYKRCEEYSGKLRNKLKKKPFWEALKNVGKGALLVGSFWLGTKVK